MITKKNLPCNHSLYWALAILLKFFTHYLSVLSSRRWTHIKHFDKVQVNCTLIGNAVRIWLERSGSTLWSLAMIDFYTISMIINVSNALPFFPFFLYLYSYYWCQLSSSFLDAWIDWITFLLCAIVVSEIWGQYQFLLMYISIDLDSFSSWELW